MDRLKHLQTYSDQELVDELKRRFALLDEARALLSGAIGPAKKNPKMSEAKREYWRPWREYKATHPGATKDEWLRSQKRKKS